jgi:hypothetical protein
MRPSAIQSGALSLPGAVAGPHGFGGVRAQLRVADRRGLRDPTLRQRPSAGRRTRRGWLSGPRRFAAAKAAPTCCSPSPTPPKTGRRRTAPSRRVCG